MKRKLTKRQWRVRRRIRRFFRVTMLLIVTFGIFLLLINGVNEWIENRQNIMQQYDDEDFVLDGVELDHGVTIEAQLLTVNRYSRPGTKLDEIKGIVIHYVGNPNTSAQNNRDYFEGLSKTHTTKASSHFVIGLEGEIIQCVPLNEVAYCSNQRNVDTISIEVCHPDETGKFKKSSYQSVVDLTAYLCEMFELEIDDVIRHYDVTQKRCPLYYVDHEDAWIQLKEDIKEEREEIILVKKSDSLE